jgi:DNA-binding MarR family transcriptional regulator
MSKLDAKNSDSKNSDSKSSEHRSEPAGRFAYDGLDRVIHEKARLSVLTSLVAHPKGLVFGDLKQMCGLTDGNLSRHLQVLDEAGLIAIEKGYDHNRPQTICRITAQGRRRYLDYLKVLEQVVQDAAGAAKAGVAHAGAAKAGAAKPDAAKAGAARAASLGPRRLKLA